MKLFNFLAAPIAFFLFNIQFINAQENWSSEHVYYGKGGVLTYTPDEQGNIIPDFSHVGYQYGDVPIPHIETVVEVEPVEGDDGATIQTAIQSLYNKTPDENGFRGAVLLKKGVYRVSGQIRIAASGIVLRGEGDSEDGTVIIAEGTSRRDLINVDNGAKRSVNSSTKVTINEDYVPVGRKYVVVSNASGFKEGDHIVLYRPGTAQWISDLKMDQVFSPWNPSHYSFYFERLITRVSGDTLFFRNPVVMSMETKYGGGSVYKYTFNRLQNIGIENLRLKSAFKFSTDEDHSWNAIAFYNTEHGWVRDLSSWYFALSCVYIKPTARLITVESSHSREPKSVIEGGKRYAFYIAGALNLFKNCSSTEGRHDYVTYSRVTGPNVFTSSTASNTYSDIGPHHRWAMGTLFDAIVSDGQINVEDRHNSGNGHGWAGANTIFWNCKGSSSVCQSPWVSAKNYNFGFIGTRNPGEKTTGRPNGEWVGHNIPGIFPASLYEAQLDERLNGTTLFSAISQLKELNDSAFIMHFNLPLIPDQIIDDNFIVTGTVDIGKDAFSLELSDEYSVIISSSVFKNLPNMATVEVKSQNLTSQEGKSLQGVTSASVTLPDLRPFVSGVAKFTDNLNGFAEASSTKPGTIYFVKYGLNIGTLAELDSLVNANLGRKADAFDVGIPIIIYTKGLPGGYYQYYAVDMDNRVSLPSPAWVSVDQLGLVTGLETPMVKQNFSARQQNRQIIIDPGNDDQTYSLDIYTITGQLFHQGKNLSGIQSVDLNGIRGVLIIRKYSKTGIDVVKLVIN